MQRKIEPIGSTATACRVREMARRTPKPTPELPLGAVLDDDGTTFAVHSATAEAIEVVLQTRWGAERVVSLARAGDRWSAHVPGVVAGDRYAVRAHGPHAPRRGLFFEAGRPLVDPWARAIDGCWSVVVDPTFDWRGDRPPRTPPERCVIYEAHVRGLTRRHPAVPAALRGTYRGMAHPAVVAELVSLGVTTIELLPVAEFVPEDDVVARGRTNYWGYCPVGYFAPHAAYAAGGAGGAQVSEFKEMVRALHAAGLEVLVDVVYNHTAEAGPGSRTLAFRGLDNPAYYRPAIGDPSRYDDVTGCGNTLDARSPIVQRLVLESLRYWVTEMHVDGFRFDLAATLGRLDDGFDPDAPLLHLIGSDPVLSGVRLIAEPWDTGPGGYAVGRFPPPWAEWNGEFRDDVREFWRGTGSSADLARALAGSEPTFATTGRGPLASVNFVTAHDGFTLRDLVSYDQKHNLSNGESNRDGSDHNRSWNSGCEGETDDEAVREVRRRRASAMVATLLLSAGVPMLVAGDERWRTQGGNNNGYCHDSPLTWLDWVDDDPLAAGMRELVTRLTTLRRTAPELTRTTFLDTGDVRWLSADGVEMGHGWWQGHDLPTLGALLEDRLLVLAHADDRDCWFTLPADLADVVFRPVLDTSAVGGAPEEGAAGGVVRVPGWSVLVLERVG
jgi:glycogen operon protein